MCSITPRRHAITQARVTFQEISTDVRAGGPSCQDGAAAGRVRERLDGWWWWWWRGAGEVRVLLIALGELWQRSGLWPKSIDKLPVLLAALCALLPPVAA